MEYVGRKVEKEARSGAVEAYSAATGLFRVVYDGGDSEEMELAEVSRLLAPPSETSIGERDAAEGNQVVSSSAPRDSGRNLADFDLNTCAEIDLNDDGDRRECGGLHGLDLNEGVNYILHDEFDSNPEGIPAPKGLMIDLNLDLNEEAAETSGAKTERCFDLNVELKEDNELAAVVEEDDDCTIVAAPQHGGGSGSGSGGDRWVSNVTALEMELMRRHIFMMSSFPAQNYALFAAGIYNFNHFVPATPQPPPLPPKVDLPPSSSSLDLNGASLLDFLSVYTFLRSFSVSLLISPFEIDDFEAAIISNDSTSLLDSVHLALLTTLRRHMYLSEEDSDSASSCLRSLNWDLLDSITWPVFLVEYLLFHSPKHIPGLDLSEFAPFQGDYYTMPAPAKVAILQHLCDDVLETEEYRVEVTRRGVMEEKQRWSSRYFSCKAKKGGSSSSSTLPEECMNEFVVDGNGDECYLCKTEGNLICCDGCPAAFHARCVGVPSSLLPDGDWFCPECTSDRGKPYRSLTEAIRAPQLLGTDPHSRHYYSCCDYLLVADSCGEEYSLSLYRGNDIPSVVAALESSRSSFHDKIVSAIRRHWNLSSHGVLTEDGGASSSSRNAGDASTSGDAGEAQERNYVNLYEFSRMAFALSKELASKWTAEDATSSAEQILARQMRVVSNKYASFSWSNIRHLSPDARMEKCGWCCSCKVPEFERDCLFVMNDAARAADGFTSQALGIQRLGDGRKTHLVDLICHIVWMEDRLHGLLSGPWSEPQFSSRWRKHAAEAAHLGYVKFLLLQLESNLHRRALSADWTKSADSAVTMGSASHVVRKSNTRRVPSKHENSRGKRKCSKQDITPTPKDGEGVSLSWWRGGRASRNLFNWKVLPRPSASKASRQGGCKKIEEVCYPDSGDYAKRNKCIAWKAAVRASKTTEQFALQVRLLDANIKWNAVGNINLLPEKGSKKPTKSFKDAVIRKRKQEGDVIKYLIDFGENKLIPDVVGKHGSLLEDSSSDSKKYWLEESHVPLHLLKAYGEKRLARAAKKVVVQELPEGSGKATASAEKKEVFQYLFERAERLERSTCKHCNESVLIREAVSCRYCKGFFHSSHANECTTSSSTVEPLYTCQKCWDKESVQPDSVHELPKHNKASKRLKHRSSKQPVHSESGVGEDPPSNRNDESPPVQTKKRRKRAKEGGDQPKKDLWSIVDNAMPKRRRADSSSSYWSNGLHFTRRTDDERVILFRSRMLLLLPGEDAPNNENPKCSLCGEMGRAPSLSYVACEKCGAWFHGDALDLSADRVQNIIGFECHSCLDKRPPVCPHQRQTGNEEDAVAP